MLLSLARKMVYATKSMRGKGEQIINRRLTITDFDWISSCAVKPNTTGTSNTRYLAERTCVPYRGCALLEWS
jgi:hypothetical protein